ncbi:MAG: hypothetical protein QNK03_23540, partial [Myxococcota bacterium]|nr:hypothetical protein [Myxococcota bacterium]
MRNLLLTLAAAALLAAPAAQAQNLLQNPDFDEGTDFWETLPGVPFTVTHEPNEDVDDDVDSGSARVNSAQDSAGGSGQGGSG